MINFIYNSMIAFINLKSKIDWDNEVIHEGMVKKGTIIFTNRIDAMFNNFKSKIYIINTLH